MPSERKLTRTSRRRIVPPYGHAAKRVIYPSSDGKPMAESPEHIDALIRAFLTLQDHYALDARVYVGADMFIYYEQGNPAAAVAPDLFVAKGVSKTRRRTSYRLWQERGVAPGFVLELTSPSTAIEDQRKAAVYARLGVQEYVLYDPRPEAREGLVIAANLLQGYQLGASGYEPLLIAPEGGLVSQELGLRLVEENDRLQWYVVATGERLLDPSERAAIAESRAAVAEARALAEAEARRDAERRAAAAEVRLAELEAMVRTEGQGPATQT